METITIPPVFCPFPQRINPHVEIAQQHVLEWVQRFRLIQKEAAQQRFLRADFGRFAAYTYPTIDMDDLLLVSDWFAWLFLIDDQLDDGTLGIHLDKTREVTAELLAVLDDTHESAHQGAHLPYRSPAVTSFADLWQRTSSYAQPGWRQRFYRHVADCFAAAQWEARNRIQGIIPDIDIYIEKRRNTGAIYICLDLIDIVRKIDLPVEVYEHAAFQTLLDTASNIIGWCNDIFSLDKEIKRGEYHNLVLLIQHVHQISLQEAVYKANDLVTREMQQFLEVEQQVPELFPECLQDVQTYLDGLKSWMCGNIGWSSTTLRYIWIEDTSSRETTEYIERIV